jgi:hypothetical protein
MIVARRKPPLPARSGFSLLEGILVTALIGLFLVISSDLTQGLRTTTKLADNREKNSQLAKVVFENIGRDLTEAVDVLSPSPDEEGESLEVRRYTEEAMVCSPTSPRLPQPPVDRFTIWDPHKSEFFLQRRYLLEGGLLVREQADTPRVEFGEIQAFRVVRTGDKLFELFVTFKEPTRDRTLSAKVTRF